MIHTLSYPSDPPQGPVVPVGGDAYIAPPPADQRADVGIGPYEWMFKK